MPAKYVFVLGLILFSSLSLRAQKGVPLDEIVAIYGDQIILNSDLETQIREFSFTHDSLEWMGRCELLAGLIYQKVLYNQSLIDSIKISDDEVNSEIERRLEYFISQIGSREALEKYYEKTVAEIKDEMKEPLREMILVRKMREQVIGNVKATPSDVTAFFNEIPKDSLPYLNTQYEVSHIVVFAKPTESEEEIARKKINDLRERIIKGEKFETMAILYSEDIASAVKGGDLGIRSRFDFVPEFSAAALKLKKDSISDIVKTQYGYHLLKMVERKGEKLHVKHILIKPKITSESRQEAQNKLKEVYREIKSDSLSFQAAAYRYSQDESTKNNGGMILNENTGSTRIPVDLMETSLFFIIDTMKVGSISGPVQLYYPDGRTAYRLILLKSKIPPHRANLKDDYPEIMALAEERKKNKALQEWIDKRITDTYIYIKEPYTDCEVLKKILEKGKTIDQ